MVYKISPDFSHIIVPFNISLLGLKPLEVYSLCIVLRLKKDTWRTARGRETRTPTLNCTDLWTSVPPYGNVAHWRQELGFIHGILFFFFFFLNDTISAQQSYRETQKRVFESWDCSKSTQNPSGQSK